MNILSFSGVELDDFPHLKAWWERINARPAVQKGISIPAKGSFGNETYLQRLKDDEEFAKSERELKEKIAAAKEQYGYKFSTP